MREKAINQETKRVLAKIGQESFLADFYLAGGTALAIQLGHRESVDLDWFSAKSFSNQYIKSVLAGLGDFHLESEETETVHGVLDKVKMSFIRYNYKLVYSLKEFQGVKLADERDIAAMKLDAISSRGSKKDFIDLYFLLQKYSLWELFRVLEDKYQGIDYNRLHMIKSLTYFDDAETEPIPKMLVDFDWASAKQAIRDRAAELS